MTDNNKTEQGGACQADCNCNAEPAPTLWNSILGRRSFVKRTGSATAAAAIAMHGFRMEVLASESCWTSKVDVGTFTVFSKTMQLSEDDLFTAETSWLKLANSPNDISKSGYKQVGGVQILQEDGCGGRKTKTSPSPLAPKNTPGDFLYTPPVGGVYSVTATIHIENRTHTGDPCPVGPQT